jgi:hypothetical protein
MPDEGWLPIGEIRLIFRHLVVSIALVVGLFIATKIFGLLAPDWAAFADDIDGFTTVGILVIVSLKLLWAFAWKGEIHAFAAA